MEMVDTFRRWLQSHRYISSAEEIPEPECYVPLLEPEMVLEFEKDALEEARQRGVDQQAYSYSIQDSDREMEDLRRAADSLVPVRNLNVRLWMWSLVHSKSPEHVKEGLRMIRTIASIEGVKWVTARNYMVQCPINREEEYYFLAVGYYRSGQPFDSIRMLENCLKLNPDCKQASSLQELIEYEMTKAGNSVVLVSASILGAIAGSIYGKVSPDTFYGSLEESFSINFFA